MNPSSTWRLSTPHRVGYDEAEALYRRLVDDSRLARGPKHPETLTAINNLAVVAGPREKIRGSRTTLPRVPAARATRSTGPSIPHALITLGNLAGALERLGRLDEAESLFRQCLEAQRRVMGPDHPRTLSTAGSLASLLRSRGRLDEAESLLRTCLEAQRRTLGADHADTLKTAATLEAIRKERSQPKEGPKP